MSDEILKTKGSIPLPVFPASCQKYRNLKLYSIKL